MLGAPTGHGSRALFPICGPDSQIQGALLLGLDKNFLSPLLCQSLVSVLMVMPAPIDRRILYQLESIAALYRLLAHPSQHTNKAHR